MRLKVTNAVCLQDVTCILVRMPHLVYLVVNGDDGVAVAQFDTGAQHTIHAVFHLCVASLYGVEIQCCFRRGLRYI